MQTFADFSKFPYNEIIDISSLFNRCDVITDRCGSDCGSGTGHTVTNDDYSEIPLNFISKFLINITNETDLNNYLENKFLTYHEGKQSILWFIFGDSIISNYESVSSEIDINQCSSEKPNPRIVRHVINLGKKGYINVQVKTVDRDVVIFCLTCADVAVSSGIESFCVAYGPKDKKIYIIDNFNKFDVSVCNSFMHLQGAILCQIFSKAKIWVVWSAKAKSGDKIGQYI